jgi:Domain of Unknown Function with PDB structure (DUF3857)
MKKNILFIVLLVFSLQLVAQDNNADATYQKLVKEYRLNADGSWDFHLEKELTLLTHFAFHSLYGETFIVYNPDFQELEIDHAFTIMADGKKVVTPKNAFNKVLPRGATHASAYNKLREMVVTHTGLEVGTSIHLAYTLKNNADFYPVFMGHENVGERSPIKEFILRVIVPFGKELTHKTYNIRTAPEITKEKMNTVYTWKFVNVKANSHDAFLAASLQPQVLFSESKRLQKTYDKFINQEAFYYPD